MRSKTVAISAMALGNCPQAQQSYFGTTAGNPKLKPITAKVWDVGFVLTPLVEAGKNLSDPDSPAWERMLPSLVAARLSDATRRAPEPRH
jgi:hypothetical protein